MSASLRFDFSKKVRPDNVLLAIQVGGMQKKQKKCMTPLAEKILCSISSLQRGMVP